MNLSEVAWLKLKKSQVVQKLVHFLPKIKRSISCSEYNHYNKYTEYTSYYSVFKHQLNVICRTAVASIIASLFIYLSKSALYKCTSRAEYSDYPHPEYRAKPAKAQSGVDGFSEESAAAKNYYVENGYRLMEQLVSK